MTSETTKKLAAGYIADMMLGHYENPVYGPIEWFSGCPGDDDCIDYVHGLNKKGGLYSDDLKELRVNVMRNLLEKMELSVEDLT